jgi:hypothetical protein
VNAKAENVSVQTKWEDTVSIVESTQDLFGHIEKMTIVNRLHSFQFKFLHRIIYFNDKLFKYHLVNASLCDFCNECIDSIDHRYFYCRVTQLFWQDVEIWLKSKYRIEYAINDANLIVTNKCATIPLIEIIMLNAKHYIYKCFLEKNLPNISKFKGVIYTVENTEHYIAQKKNLLTVHNTRWHVSV